VSRNICC